MTVIDEVVAELARARRLFPRREASAHEGFAVLYEEVDELWDEVKMQEQSREAMRKEALHCAAMAMRFVVDVLDMPPVSLPAGSDRSGQ